ncbi:hypothetical protein LR68_00008 [Anoxybacillus sp. BCO1]|nr:hypothetical protein LR68_00008 [Anoxybacillus sp. BCO1]
MGKINFANRSLQYGKPVDEQTWKKAIETKSKSNIR